MYKNVIDPGKSVSFVLKDIDIGGQNQYAMCTGPFKGVFSINKNKLSKLFVLLPLNMWLV